MNRFAKGLGTALLACTAVAPIAIAQTGDQLKMGVRAAIVTLDPAVSGLGTMHGYYRHIYDPLILRDPAVQPLPGLATSWKIVDPTTWEFELRKGVKFHDGSDFDANDVVFTWRRLYTTPNSDNLTAGKLKPVVDIKVLDPYRIQMITDKPYPGLITALPEMHITSDSIGQATTEDFNTGKATIGTGPFKHASWTRGSKWDLERFDGYWGEKTPFAKATLREVPNDAARVAGLEAGDLDFIDYVPPLDVKRLTANPKIEVFRTPSARTIFLQFESLRDQTAFVFDKTGKPLPVNPFKDERVRLALAKAINQDAIVGRIMEGLATPATQAVPAGFKGYNATVKPPKYDPDGAKKLLTEAGYPNGFKMTLHCPNNRYVNDAAICQASGQMLARIGIDVEIEAMPTNVYFPRLTNREFSAYMLGWGNNAGDAASFLRDVIYTRDKDRGTGSWNMAFSDPALDKKIEAATMSMDMEKRAQMMAETMGEAVEKTVYVPLHAQLVIAATRKGLVYSPMADESTLAIMVRKPN